MLLSDVVGRATPLSASFGWDTPAVLRSVRDLVEGSLRAAQRRDRLIDHLSRQGRGFEPAAVEALRAGVRARRLQYDADLTAGSACYQHERTVHDGRKGWRLCDLVLRPEAWGPVIGVEVKAFCPTSGSATAMGNTVGADLRKLAMYLARKQVAFGVLERRSTHKLKQA